MDVAVAVGCARAVAVGGCLEVEIDEAPRVQPPHRGVSLEAGEPKPLFPRVFLVASQHAPQVLARLQLVGHPLGPIQRGNGPVPVRLRLGRWNVLQQSVALFDAGQRVFRQEGALPWTGGCSVGGAFRRRLPGDEAASQDLPLAEMHRIADLLPSQSAAFPHLQLNGFEAVIAFGCGRTGEVQVQDLAGFESPDGVLPVDGADPRYGFIPGDAEGPEDPPQGVAAVDDANDPFQGLE